MHEKFDAAKGTVPFSPTRKSGKSPRQSLRWGAMFSVFFAACAGGVYLHAFDPAESGTYPPCLFHAITGLQCPGCGTLRALHQLLHGNLKEAFFLNPLAVALLPPVAYGLLSIAIKATGKKPLPTVFIPAFWIWALLAVILAFGMLRNLPFYPFSLFSP